MLDLTKPTQSMSDEAAKVMRNTFGLVSMMLFVTVIAGFMSNAMGLGMAMLSNTIGFIAFIVIQIALIFAVFKYANSSIGLGLVFVFAAFEGVFLDPLVAIHAKMNPGVVTMAIGLTATITAVMAVLGATTKKDYSFMGKFLFVGIITLLVASIINIFLQLPMLHMLISAVGSIIFSLYILHDTNDIAHGRETNYVRAGLGMFINICGLFVHLLSFLGSFTGDD